MTIIKGRNWISEDAYSLSNETKSLDFKLYVKLHFRAKKYGKTKVVDKTKCPTWNKKVTIAIGAEDGNHALQGLTDLTSLSLRLFDEAASNGNSFIGESIIPLSLTESLTKPPK